MLSSTCTCACVWLLRLLYTLLVYGTCVHELSVDPVFGCELQKLCERENTNVPKFLVQFMEHIEDKGLEVVGIYRLSGNAASVTKLRYLVEQGEKSS